LIVYFDTSALVPIVVAEPTTHTCRRIWDDADRRVSSRLTCVEVAAALAMAERQRRMSAEQHGEAWSSFAEIWPAADTVELTPELSEDAAGLTRTLAVRGYDAVHCASAASLDDTDLVAAAGDARLLAAWRSLGIAVLDTNQDP